MGRCKSFDSTGDGYGRGEGFTIALLRCAPWQILIAAQYDGLIHTLSTTGKANSPAGFQVKNSQAGML